MVLERGRPVPDAESTWPEGRDGIGGRVFEADGMGPPLTLERFPALVGKLRKEDVPLCLEEARLEATPFVLALRLRPCRFRFVDDEFQPGTRGIEGASAVSGKYRSKGAAGAGLVGFAGNAVRDEPSTEADASGIEGVA